MVSHAEAATGVLLNSGKTNPGGTQMMTNMAFIMYNLL
jgi:hypothetical protein